MTKLEELKAASDAAEDAWDAAYKAYTEAVGPDKAAAYDAAAEAADAYAAYGAAEEVWAAYRIELKKQQENSNG